MALLSLRHFLQAGEEEAVGKKVTCLLLEKIGSAAVEGDPAEHAIFEAEMTGFRERACLDGSTGDLYLTAGSAVQAMESYNRRITAFLRKQGAEMQGIVSMMAETLLKMGGESTLSAQRLQEIGNRFEHAGTMDDLQALKTQLGTCLKSFRQEAQRQKEETDAAIRSLQDEVERRQARASLPIKGDLDPVTGLPCRSAALLSMQEATRAGKKHTRSLWC